MHAARGLAGGPGNAGGIDYQLQVIADLVLERLARADARLGSTVLLEARDLEKGEESAWDALLEPEGSWYEVKRRVTRRDLREFADRAAVRLSKDPHARAVLVYSESESTDALEALVQATLRAREASDEQNLRHLLTYDGIADRASDLLNAFGDSARSSLLRVEIHRRGGPDLLATLRLRAETLMASGRHRDAVSLIDALAQRLLSGAAIRERLELAVLAGEFRTRFDLVFPLSAGGVEPRLEAILKVLVRLRSPSPTQYLMAASELSETEWNRAVSPLIADRSLAVLDQTILYTAGSTQPDPDAATLRRVLWAAIAWARDVRSPIAWAQFQNIYDIASMLLVHSPSDVAPVYQAMEKLLKRAGEKPRVFAFARLSLEAARLAPRNQTMAEARAHALICGLSWFYQRVDRLDLALVEAKRSRELGQQIQWARNTAFCEKCIGRLLRLQAEEAAPGPQRDRALADSEATLLQAVTLFSQHPDFGSMHEEVGDCYSLLGRTRLVAGDLDGAVRAVNEAAQRIPEEPGLKDYWDLALLRADVTLTDRGPSAAMSEYRRIVDDLYDGSNAELSEIRGRLLLARGENSLRLKDRASGLSDLDAAQQIASRLGDGFLLARATWAKYALNLPPEALSLLSAERVDVRAEVARLYELRRPRGTAVARRASGRGGSTPIGYWRALIEESRRNVATVGGG